MLDALALGEQPREDLARRRAVLRRHHMIDPARAHQLAGRVAQQLAAMTVEQSDGAVAVEDHEQRAGDIEVGLGAIALDAQDGLDDPRLISALLALPELDQHNCPARDLGDGPGHLGDGQLAAQRGAVTAPDRHHRLAGPGGLAGRRAEHVLEAAAERNVGGPAGLRLERVVDVQHRRVLVAAVRQAHRNPERVQQGGARRHSAWGNRSH